MPALPVISLPGFRSMLPYLLLGLALLCFSEMSFAVNSIGNAGSILSTDIKKFGPFVKWTVVLVGLALVGAGINGFIQAQKREESVMGPLTMLIAGILMVSIIGVIGMGGASFGLDGSGSTDVSTLVGG